MRLLSRLTPFSLFLCLSLSASLLTGQIRGVVFDGESGEALAFAQIQSIRTQEGCFSGLEGQFSLDIPAQGDSIRVSLLGYQAIVVAARANASIKIELLPGGISLDNVEIFAGENPALRIMRNVVKLRTKNDPQKLKNFSFDSYNKLKAMPLYPDSYPDSSQIKFPILLSETVTHRDQYGFGKIKEVIQSARLAGYPGEVLPITASDLQDLSFYQNFIGVIGQQFLSPVSPNGLRQYDFELLEVLPFGADTIFQIGFKPHKPNFDGLEGSFRIHSQNWAISTAEAKLIFGGQSQLFTDGHIRQVCLEDSSGRWLPWQVYTIAETKQYAKSMPMWFEVSGFSEFSNHQLGKDLKGNFRADKALILSDDIGTEDSLLVASRSKPIDSLEDASYQFLDSLGRKFKLALLLNQSFKLANNRIGIGHMDLLLGQLYDRNEVEGSRFSLGIATNEKLSQRGNIQFDAGYGIRDKKWKYGGAINIFPLANPRLFLGASYRKDLVEAGHRRLGLNPNRLLFEDLFEESGIRNWYLRRMDYVTTQEVWIGGEPFSNLALKASWRIEETVPAYETYFKDSSQFNFSEAGLIIRWSPKSRYALQKGRRMRMDTRFPILSLRYMRGLDDNFGDFDYQSLAFSFTTRFKAINGGYGNLSLFAGANDRSLPRSRMHIYRASYSKRNPTSLLTAFNTMRYGEFAADAYAEGFLSFSPKLKWLRIGKRFRPKLRFNCAAAWGMLYEESQDVHGPVDPKAPDRIYLEPGLALTNILPIPENDNLAMTLLRGFGVSVSYRAGYYTFSDYRRDLIARLTFEL